jgi:hypothetical protein
MVAFYYEIILLRLVNHAIIKSKIRLGGKHKSKVRKFSMKSKLFTKYVVPSDDFAKTSKILENLPIDCRDDFVKWFNNLKVEPHRLEYDFLSPPETLQELRARLHISSDDFDKLFSYIRYITRWAYRVEDNLNDIVDDMAILELISEDSKNELKSFFEQINAKGIEFAKQQTRSIYQKAQIPILDGIEYDVDLRLVVKTPFDATDVKIEDYEPKGQELIQIAIVSLTINDGTKKSKTLFQLNFNELEDVIVNLQACQKEMRVLESFINKNDISGSS